MPIEKWKNCSIRWYLNVGIIISSEREGGVGGGVCNIACMNGSAPTLFDPKPLKHEIELNNRTNQTHLIPIRRLEVEVDGSATLITL